MIDPQLENKVVFITGANSGIGAVTAKAFAAQGALVAIHFLQAKPVIDTAYTPLHTVKGKSAADEILRQIQEQGGHAIAVDGDLSDASTIPALFDKVEETFGRVDILVNNAAHCENPDVILATSAGSVDRTFAVNTRAVVLMIAEFARRYQRRAGTWGRVINLSTDAAQTFAGQVCYGASKAATEAFTRTAAIELGSLGITVNAIAPGPIQLGQMTSQSEERLVQAIPLGRIGHPQDIANAIVFLASEQANWLTGQVIKVSGGHEI